MSGTEIRFSLRRSMFDVQSSTFVFELNRHKYENHAARFRDGLAPGTAISTPVEIGEPNSGNPLAPHPNRWA
jgi:hypothetical protein